MTLEPTTVLRRPVRALLAGLFSTALLFPTPATAGETKGTWSLEVGKDGEGARLDLRRRSPGHSFHSSFRVPVSQLEGLEAALRDASRPAVRLTFRRDAGSFLLEGELRGGEGAGHFTFSADPGYLSEMLAAGHRLEDDDVLAAAVHDVSRPFVRDLDSLGYSRLDFGDLLAFRIHGVSPDGIRELRSLGYERLEADELVALRIHGATPDYVRSLRSAGLEASADEVVALRIHGATPAFLTTLGELGYRGLSANELVAMRIHGVRADFIRQLQELGYEHPTADELVSMRIHGVTPEFVRRANERSGEHLPIDELVSMRVRGRG